MVARATSVNCRSLVDCLVNYDFKTRLPGAWMFTCINNEVSRCYAEKSNPKSKKTIRFRDFWRKKSLPICSGFGGLHYTCPNLTRTMHLNALTRCCKSAAIFSSQISAWFRTWSWVGRRFDTHLSLYGFLESPGHQNSSLREAQPVYYFSMVLN